jgi:tetratricopeptide (TPR) repeat protein
MFGATEQLFSRGQRALAQRDFSGAERLLRAALARDPAYAHVHLYLAHALAEQERLVDAERSLATAMKMAPALFVFPLHHGIVLLDAGDPARARAAVARAARLAPDNGLVAGYAHLVAWTESGGPPPPRLAELVGELPESFRVRALLRLAEITLEMRGPKGALDLLDPPPEPMGLPFTLWLAALRHGDRLAYAERLVERGRFEEAAYLITSRPALMADPRGPALLDRARRGALRTLDEALASSTPARRRTLLLHRYEVENELGDRDAVVRTLGEWRDAYAAAGAPAGQRHVAAAVIRRMAAAEIEGGRHHEGLALCAASRAARCERETAGVAAVARLGLGQRRAARYAFEDFLKDALFPLDVRLREAAGSSPA